MVKATCVLTGFFDIATLPGVQPPLPALSSSSTAGGLKSGVLRAVVLNLGGGGRGFAPQGTIGKPGEGV